VQVRGWVARGCNRFKQSFDAGDSNGRFNDCKGRWGWMLWEDCKAGCRQGERVESSREGALLSCFCRSPVLLCRCVAVFPVMLRGDDGRGDARGDGGVLLSGAIWCCLVLSGAIWGAFSSLCSLCVLSPSLGDGHAGCGALRGGVRGLLCALGLAGALVLVLCPPPLSSPLGGHGSPMWAGEVMGSWVHGGAIGQAG
jgi:hypothetical protein